MSTPHAALQRGCALPTVPFHKCRFIINSVMEDLNYEVGFNARAATGPGGRPRSSPGQNADVQRDLRGTQIRRAQLRLSGLSREAGEEVGEAHSIEVTH